ncbi:MAG: hypothetical protein ACJ0BV_11575 [Paracoccaceae bacterium]
MGTPEDDLAFKIQMGVSSRESVNLKDGMDAYNQKEVRQAIVHTRQDLVLVYSKLGSLIEIMKSTKLILRAIFIVLIIFLLLYGYNNI